MDLLNGLKRTDYCLGACEEKVGSRMTVAGWVSVARNLGSLIFADVRDRTGILQAVFDVSAYPDVFKKAETLKFEFVVAVSGTLRVRSQINPGIPTGRWEILADDLRILAESETPPFEIADPKVNELLRLKYRYLELRAPHLQRNLMIRSKICKAARDYMDANGFIEFETPYLGKSTPEGARDYLVPSRLAHGSFYALPQSPQLYKQLLMISGMDRYYQITRCFRDEDLRSNRQPEFSQIDIEMSFVERDEDVMIVLEGLIRAIFKDVIDYDIGVVPRLKYAEAMEKYGSDKPDTRFGLEIVNVTGLVKDCGFSVFASAANEPDGSVRMINARGFARGDQPILTRRGIDELAEFVKTYRAKGLAYIVMREDGPQGGFLKFLDPGIVDALVKAVGAVAGDVLFFVADKNKVVFDALGALRLKLAETGKLIDKTKFDFLWITEFPEFEYSEEEGRWTAMHHPFTAPFDEDWALLESDPGRVRAKAYDFVINGMEAGGGSIRIHTRDKQARMFAALGLSDNQIEDRFGFFVNAFRYGAPPHGGCAFGLDRLTMILAGTDNIRDVITFPKNQNAQDLMLQAPSAVDERQLAELGMKY
ncbi:MAG: aspartate--tRNA ligase [Firmicutes bacterium]|nr:aspartate--tRNA ligase [Bacillota bacterium]